MRRGVRGGVRDGGWWVVGEEEMGWGGGIEGGGESGGGVEVIVETYAGADSDEGC